MEKPLKGWKTGLSEKPESASSASWALCVVVGREGGTSGQGRVVRAGQATVGPSETLRGYGHALCFRRVRDHPGDVLGCKSASPAAITLCVLSPFLMNWVKLVGLQYMSACSLACTLANLKSHHLENSATLLLCFASESAASSCY